MEEHIMIDFRFLFTKKEQKTEEKKEKREQAQVNTSTHRFQLQPCRI